MIEHATLSEASRILKVDKNTIRRWDRSGKIRVNRTFGGHRRVPISEIDRIQGIENPERTITLAYCRVSTQKQSDNLERQVGRVLEFCNKNKWRDVELFKDVGSGLNDNRKQFRSLIKRISSPDIERVVVEYKDRLTRFGFETFSTYCENLGVEVITIEDSEEKEFEQEFADDIISLVASYSGRLYGRRGGRKKK